MPKDRRVNEFETRGTQVLDKTSRENIQIEELRERAVMIVTIKGDIVGEDVARSVMEIAMRRLGLLDDPQRLLVRSIRTTEIPNVLERGTERNGNSLYRDRVLEEDFGFTPDMYICAFPNQGRVLPRIF